jgi:hypothetical protein
MLLQGLCGGPDLRCSVWLGITPSNRSGSRRFGMLQQGKSLGKHSASYMH